MGLRSGFVHAKGQEKIYYRITILITLQLVTVTKYTKSLSTVTISFLKFHTQTFFYFNCILQWLIVEKIKQVKIQQKKIQVQNKEKFHDQSQF